MLLKPLPLSPFFDQFYRCLEGDKATDLAHIDPIAIGIKDRRGGTDNEDLFRIQCDQFLHQRLF